MMAILRIVCVTGSFVLFVQATLLRAKEAMGWKRHGGEMPHSAASSILPAALREGLFRAVSHGLIEV
jgi:hypothetical protein